MNSCHCVTLEKLNLFWACGRLVEEDVSVFAQYCVVIRAQKEYLPPGQLQPVLK